MTPVVTFELSDRDLKDLQRVLNPKQFKQACFAIVQRTTNQAVRIATKAVKEKINIPQRYISGKAHRRAAITSKLSRGDVPVGVVSIRYVGVPASAFPHTATKEGGVTVRMDKNREPLHLKHAFVARVASKAQERQGASHTGIFTRTKNAGSAAKWYGKNFKGYDPAKLARAGIKPGRWTAAGRDMLGQVTPEGYAWRLPIQEHFGPSVLAFISRAEIQSAIFQQIGDYQARMVDSQVSRFTEGKFKTLYDAVSALPFISDV